MVRRRAKPARPGAAAIRYQPWISLGEATRRMRTGRDVTLRMMLAGALPYRPVQFRWRIEQLLLPAQRRASFAGRAIPWRISAAMVSYFRNIEAARPGTLRARYGKPSRGRAGFRPSPPLSGAQRSVLLAHLRRRLHGGR